MGKTDYQRTAAQYLVDGAVRLVYRIGYRLMTRIWRVWKPHHNGVGVLVRHGGQVLAVLHSYRPGYTVPGGGAGRRENPREAAVRELSEELSIIADPDDLVYKRHVYNTRLYELRLTDRPDIRIDHREIIDARFVSPEEAIRLSPSFRRYI